MTPPATYLDHGWPQAAGVAVGRRPHPMLAAFAVSAPEPKNTTLKPFVHKSDVVLAVSTKVLVSVESRPALIQDPRLELMSLQNQRVAPVPE